MDLLPVRERRVLSEHKAVGGFVLSKAPHHLLPSRAVSQRFLEAGCEDQLRKDKTAACSHVLGHRYYHSLCSQHQSSVPRQLTQVPSS